MKKNIVTKKATTAILAGALALSFAGCSELDPEVDANAQAAGNAAAGESNAPAAEHACALTVSAAESLVHLVKKAELYIGMCFAGSRDVG